MALKLSTGLRQAIAGAQDSITGTTIGFTASTNVIADSGNGLFAAGFRPGDAIKISGASNAANNVWTEVVSIAASGASMVVAAALATEAASQSVTIRAAGKSLKDVFRNHVLRIYSGSAPATADAAETGTLLAEITVGGLAVTPGTSTNGMSFGTPAAGVLGKASETQQGDGLADGTAGYYRCYDNGVVAGSSATAKRMQGTVGTSGADCILGSTSINSGAPVVISQHNVTVPAS
jgi:hypothetical protein